MQQNQTEAGADLVDLYGLLNNVRASFKKKPFFQDCLGEQAVKELLFNNVQSNDPLLKQIIQKYGISFNASLDYLIYEVQSHPMGVQHTNQVFNSTLIFVQEMQQVLEKGLDDMINAVFKLKLLGNIYTHVSFGFQQSGQKSENFKIVALVTKKNLMLEGIVFCKSSVQSGYIFVGKVLDPLKKPCIFSINRGNQGQIVVGPNKIVYSQETGEFRVLLQDIYYGLVVSDILFNSQSMNILEIFVAPANDNSFQYGQGVDFPQNYNDFQELEIGISEIIKDPNSVLNRNADLQSTFIQANLISTGTSSQNSLPNQPFQRAKTSITPQVQLSSQITGGQYGAIRKTKAQLLREQNAALQKGAQANTTTTNNGFTQVIQNDASKTPMLNRCQTQIFIPAGNSQSQPAFKTSNTVTNFRRNENFNPNMNQQSQQPLNFQYKPPAMTTQSQSQAFQISQNPNLNNQQQMTFKTSGFNNSSSSAFQTFKPPFSQTQATPKFQFSFPQQNQTQQNLPYQPSQTMPTYSQPSFQSQSSGPQQRFNFNPSQSSSAFNNSSGPGSFNLNFKSSNTQQTQGSSQNQQPTFKYNPPTTQNITNSMSYQSTSNNSFMPVDTTNNNIMQQQQQSSYIFNQLSLIDQETLKQYLKELQEDLDVEQMSKVTMLMLTDPFKFYDFFKTAHEQLEASKAKKATQSSKTQPGTATQQQQNQDQQQKQQPQHLNLSKFDDMTLFLLNIPPQLIKNKEYKFALYLNQLKEGTMSSKQLAKKMLIRNPYPVNESFKSMMSHKESADLILHLKNEEFLCHKIVFTSTSDYFKSAIKQNEFINKYKHGIEGPFRQKLGIPEWMDLDAFKLFIKFVYTGKIGQSDIQLDVKDLVNLLRIGNYFYHQSLQENLIADIIIPTMSPQSAIIFLKLCSTSEEDQNHRNSSTYAWAFLQEYAQFFLQKHLPIVIRQNPILLYDLQSLQLRRIIDKSLLYMVDGSQDLETILQFTADTWADKNICKLLNKSQRALDSCSAFDFQIIPQLSDFLSQLDPSLDYQCRHIKGEDLKLSLLQSNNTSPSTSTLNNPIPAAKGSTNNDPQQKGLSDSTFIIAGQDNNNINDAKGLASAGSVGSSNGSLSENREIDLAQWKTKANIIKHVDNQSDIFDSKEPQYHTVIQLDTIKADFEKNKGASIFTKAFDFGRRSWILKIDIDFDKNLSLYLIERGLPLIASQQDDNIHVGLNVPIRYSSVVAQFEILDQAFGEHKSVFFYSYAHDHNQTIGHQNILNLNQLQNQSQLSLKVHMKEFILHSAIMHYLSQNFQEIYRKELKIVESNKRLYNSLFSTISNSNIVEYDLLNMRFYNVYQLLSSNNLKVEDENLVLGFLFYYTQIQASKQAYRENIGFLCDLITLQVRFYYLQTSKIISALRDNSFLRHSKLFLSRVNDEFLQRVQNTTPLVLNLNQQNNSTSKYQKISSKPRKYYDPIKVQTVGRRKYESKNQPGIGNCQVFIEELVEWLKTSKHDKKDKHEFIDSEVRKWQNLYYEERKKCQNLMNQLSLSEKKIEQLENYIKQYGPTNGTGVHGGYQLPKSLSNDNRFAYQQDMYIGQQKQASQVPAISAGAMNNLQKFISPIKRNPPAFISNNDIVQNRQSHHHAPNYSMYNSFDQSLFHNNRDWLAQDSVRKYCRGGSTAKAERKIKENFEPDVSMLLRNVGGGNQGFNNNGFAGRQYSPQQSKRNNGNEYVPYYRQSRYRQTAGGDSDGGQTKECLIF